MILTGSEIRRRRDMGDIVIYPWNENQLNPNSYNLRLGNRFLIYKVDRVQSIYDNPTPDAEFNIPMDQKFQIYPGDLVLAETLEHTETHGLVPMIESRSSMARQFCPVHSAGFGDIGFTGKWTLELSPRVITTLWPGMEICQIYYHTIEGSADMVYQGRYNNNSGVETVKMGGE